MVPAPSTATRWRVRMSNVECISDNRDSALCPRPVSSGRTMSLRRGQSALSRLSRVLRNFPQLVLVHLSVGPLQDIGYGLAGPPTGDANRRAHGDLMLRVAGYDHELLGQPLRDARNVG